MVTRKIFCSMNAGVRLTHLPCEHNCSGRRPRKSMFCLVRIILTMKSVQPIANPSAVRAPWTPPSLLSFMFATAFPIRLQSMKPWAAQAMDIPHWQRPRGLPIGRSLELMPRSCGILATWNLFQSHPTVKVILTGSKTRKVCRLRLLLI